MTLLRLGRDIIDNNLAGVSSLPFLPMLSKLPIPFVFPGRRLDLPFPTPLVLSVYLGRYDVIGFLLSKGVDPNAVHPPTGWCPIHFAALVNDLRAMTLLCGNNAEADAIGTVGETALHVAVLNGHYHAAAFLLEKGADPNRRVNDDTAASAIQLAVNTGSRALMALLLHHGVDCGGLDFSRADDRAGIERFIAEEDWRGEDWDPERMADSHSDSRVDDVLEFKYPECPPVDVHRRYTNQEYVRQVLERNKRLTS
jgi:hypothetical protein